jgi:hypothetical protein
VRDGMFAIEIHARTGADERRVCRVEAQGKAFRVAGAILLVATVGAAVMWFAQGLEAGLCEDNQGPGYCAAKEDDDTVWAIGFVVLLIATIGAFLAASRRDG